MPPKNRFLIFALLWHIACWYGLLKESSGTPPPFPHFDKFAHFSLFFAQIWLLARNYREAGRQPPWTSLTVFALLFAISSEVAQATLTQTRSGDILDAVADMLGTGAALLLTRKVLQHQKTSR